MNLSVHFQFSSKKKSVSEVLFFQYLIAKNRVQVAGKQKITKDGLYRASSRQQ